MFCIIHFQGVSIPKTPPNCGLGVSQVQSNLLLCAYLLGSSGFLDGDRFYMQLPPQKHPVSTSGDVYGLTDKAVTTLSSHAVDDKATTWSHNFCEFTWLQRSSNFNLIYKCQFFVLSVSSDWLFHSWYRHVLVIDKEPSAVYFVRTLTELLFFVKWYTQVCIARKLVCSVRKSLLFVMRLRPKIGSEGL
jgi:hypothetical protein